MLSVIVFGLYMSALIEVGSFKVDDMQSCMLNALIITEQAAGKQFAFCLNPLMDF